MAEFVQSVANQQMPPPYHFPGVTAHGFMFEVPMAAVQRYCDTYFNLGPAAERGFAYRSIPLFPYATLMAIRYPVMISESRAHLAYNGTPFAERGYTRQNEIFVAIPLLRYGTTVQNIVLDAAIEWALPFIAVDNSTSAFSGREMLGLEKLKGEINFGADPVDPRRFFAEVTLPGWRSLDPDCRQEMLPFLSIKTGPPLGSERDPDRRRSPWGFVGTDLGRKAVEGLAAAFTGLDTMSLGLLPTPMQVVALKQFRDAHAVGTAVYQALVGARSRYANVTNLQFYNEKGVEIVFHDGGSFGEVIRAFLSPPANTSEQAATFQPVAVPVSAAFSFNADIDFDNMRTLHTFTAEGRKGARADRPADDGATAPWLRPWRGFWGRA
jgi:hypothetical protein